MPIDRNVSNVRRCSAFASRIAQKLSLVQDMKRVGAERT